MDNTILSHYPALPASRLQRLLDKPFTEWSVDDLVQVFLESGLRQVSLMHAGGDSALKVLDFVPRDVDHLRRILRAGERADGSSLFPKSGIGARASDIILRPRPETAFIDPFAAHGSLVLLCGHAQRDGSELPQSGDTILRNAFRRLQTEAGFELHALGEVEYFLGTEPIERDLQSVGDRGYHATSPYVFGEELRREALSMLAEIGVPVKYGHSEVGFAPSELETDLVWEQHEIELALQPLPQAADSVLITQWVLRNLARRMGMRISFEPVVRKGHAGSGMHFHLAAFRGNEFCPVIVKESLDETARWIIGGLLKYGGALMAFGNRKPGSFLRLFQGKEAPTGVTWGRFNRKALVRL
ncbi:glutamine synthetase, partial [bacterium]|nr:glutamine synthetase [bacterium]